MRLVEVRLKARYFFLCLLCLAIVFLSIGRAAAGCQVESRATVPVRLEDGLAVVEVTIDGASVPMILDTGADRTVLTAAAVARLRLPPDPWTGTTLRGAGGRLEGRRNVSPDSIRLGGVALRRRALSPKLSLPVIAGLGRQDGLLGDDLLSLFDLDLDLPGGTLTLFSVRDCNGRFIPWDRPYEAVPIQLGMRSRAMPLVPVRLDGRPLDAVLDTGASVSFLNLRGMRRMGLTPAMLEQDPAVAAGAVGGMAATRRHRFAAIAVGAVTLRDPELLVAPVPTPIFDLLLGVDFWRSCRLWISYASSQIFVGRM